MEPLTEKQQRVLTFIVGRLRENHPPSQREIAQHFHLAQNAVYQLIGYLKRKGYLVDSGGHRGLRLSEAYGNEVAPPGLPIVGRVAAGEPILAEENVEGYLGVERLFDRSQGAFALKVSGDSMIDEGILDGDYVVVQLTPRLENGQIGVVLLGDEATVKRVFVQKDRIALKPANRRARYKTRYVKRSDKEVRIIGKVIGCVRIDIR